MLVADILEDNVAESIKISTCTPMTQHFHILVCTQSSCLCARGSLHKTVHFSTISTEKLELNFILVHRRMVQL